MYEFKFPFEPPWEDLKMTVTTSTGAKCYIFDSCVERDPVKRAAMDKDLGELLAQFERRKFIERMNSESGA